MDVPVKACHCCLGVTAMALRGSIAGYKIKDAMAEYSGPSKANPPIHTPVFPTVSSQSSISWKDHLSA